MKRQDQRGQPVQQQTQPKPEAADPQQQTRGKCHVLPSPPHTPTTTTTTFPTCLAVEGNAGSFASALRISSSWLRYVSGAKLDNSGCRVNRLARVPLRPWCPASPQGEGPVALRFSPARPTMSRSSSGSRHPMSPATENRTDVDAAREGLTRSRQVGCWIGPAVNARPRAHVGIASSGLTTAPK